MSKESRLAKILRFFVYAASLVPLVIFSEYLSPFHFGKVVVFRSLVEIMLIFYLLLVWRDRSYLPKKDGITWSFFVFVCAFTLTTLTSVNVYQSFWGTLERMGGLWTFWHYFAYFVILISVFRTKAEWAKLLKLMIVVGILSALYGFGQKTDSEFFIGSGNRARIFGTIGNAALFAGYQLLILFLSLTLLFRRGNTPNEKLLFSAGFVFSVIAVLMTAVRGSILALVVGLLLFSLLHMRFYNSRMARKVVIGLVLLAVAFVVFANVMRDSEFVANSGYLTRLTDFSLETRTVKTRFWAWQAGISGWNDNFKTVVLGWGPENFNIPFSLNFNPAFFEGPGSETLFDRGHNMFVEVLVTMGILGFAAYLGMFAAIFRSIKNIKKEELSYAAGFIPLVVTYMIHNSFIFDTSANFIVFFTILGFIRSVTVQNSAESPEAKASVRKPVSTLQKSFIFVSVVIVGFVIFQTNIIPAKANYATTRAITRGWSKDFSGSVSKYKEALEYETFGKYEIRHRMAQFVLDFVSSGKIDENRANVIKYVIEQVQKNADNNRLDYLPHLYLSRLNITLGKNDPESPYNDIALEHVNRALEIAPNFVRSYYEIAQVYLNRKDYTTASEWFKKAADLNPDVGITYWYWGLTEIESGRGKMGLELLATARAKGYSPNENDLGRVINYYGKINDIPNLIASFEEIIKINPRNAQYRASLAAAYVKVGRIDDAVVQAREAAKIDPSFAPEAKAFVQSLGRVW